MNILNFEFKARTRNLAEMEEKLLALKPEFIGEDHQIDTYFNVSSGRLKLREGNVENSLIHYERADTADAKQSKILLYEHQPSRSLKEILIKTLGVKTVVDKRRRIYFIENVKFHFDILPLLGTFIEVEAIDRSGLMTIEKLSEQCRKYADFFGINQADYVSESYSDLVLAAQVSR